jgi:Tir chaperone protein (CesT) family
MVKNLFEALLDEVGHALKIADLHADRNNTCLISMPNGVKIQLEMHSRTQEFVLGSDLGQIPPGRYRENLFIEALRSNGMPNHVGILAYSAKNDHLILFQTINLKDLTGERIATDMSPFIEKAKIWQEAMEKGEIPVVANMRTSMGMFGLRP